MANTTSPRDRDGFQIAIVCALKLERDAVEALIEVDFKEQGRTYGKAEQDRNVYTTGILGGKPVVLAYPRDMGTLNAATVASDMRYSFKNIRICLLVGVTGGAPRTPDGSDILLGDVIIGTAVIQNDFGRQYPDGLKRKREAESTLGRATTEIAHFLALLEGDKTIRRLTSKTVQYSHASAFTGKFAHPGPGADHLFPSDYRHKHQDAQKCEICRNCINWDDPVCDEAEKASCDELACDKSTSPRRNTDNNERVQKDGARIHFGRIASANAVMKSGLQRDKLVAGEGVIGFEMEGAGTWDQLPTVVVKSVCDYSDSHKNKLWQAYAAATAASCAKAMIEEWETSDPPHAELRPVSAPHFSVPHFSVPFSLENVPALPDGKFVGRTEELERIRDCLCRDPTRTCRRKTFVICGMGGMGKTQLAVEFARWQWKAFNAVFWLNGSSKERVEQAFVQIAHQIPVGQLGVELDKMGEVLDVDRIIREVLTWLSIPDNKDWLMIFDNVDRVHNGVAADEQAFDVSKMLPFADHGSVLITTRLATVTQLGSSLDLGHVNEMEARTILEQEAGTVLEDAATLVGKLNGLPLALTQAGAYMKMTRIGVKEYTQYYDETWSELMEYQGAYALQEYAERSLLTTWMMSYQQVQRKSESAASLLKLWSVLSRDGLWYEIIESVQRLHNLDGVPAWLTQMASSKLRFTEAMGVLSTYSLIDRECHGNAYTLHPVLHRWCYSLLTLEEERRLLLLGCFLVAEMIPRKLERSWAQDRPLLPHVLQLLDRPVERFETGENVLYASACWQMGWLLQRQSMLVETEEMYTRTLEVYEKAPEAEHSITLKVVSELATLYRQQGKLAEAEEMYEKALKGREKVLGLEHTSTLDTVYELGSVYFDQGKLDHAEAMCIRALMGYEKMLGAEHTSTLRLVHDFGTLYRHQGKLAEAEEMYERAFKGRKKVLGVDHAYTLHTVYHLGCLYLDQGELQNAEAMFIRALKGYEKALGVEHTFTLAILHAFGNLHKADGKLVQVDRLSQRALQGRDKTSGAGHTSTVQSSRALCSIYSRMEIQRRRGLNSSHSSGFRCLDKGQPDPTQQLLSDYIHLCRQNPYSTLRLYGELGRLLIWLGKEDSALIAFEQQITLVDGEWRYSDPWCDGCGERVSLRSGRFICKSCPDIDLCQKCHEKYERDEIKVVGCRDHTFLACPSSEWESFTPGTVTSRGETLAEWLESLKIST